MYPIHHFCRRKAGNPISNNQAIKIENMSNTVVRQRKCFADAVQSVLNCTKAFEEDYAVSNVAEHVVDIFRDMMSSIFLAASSKSHLYALSSSHHDDDQKGGCSVSICEPFHGYASGGNAGHHSS